MKLLAVLVNYKTAEMTMRSVRAALPELAGLDARVVVVDNDSQDGSFEEMRQVVAAEGLGDRVEVIASDKNGGFGYGCNFGIRRYLGAKDQPEYIYLLNSDAFPDPGSIHELVRFMDEHTEVGITGSYIHGVDGVPHETAFRFPTVWSEFESALRLGLVTKLLQRFVVPLPIPQEATQVDWLAGASMMIRRAVLEDVGLFDETFFLYYEEVDLCRRARLAGWPTWYIPASSVAHIGHGTTGLKDKTRRTPTYWFASRRYYFLKNHGRPYLWAANAAFLTGFSLWRLRRRIQGKPDPDRPKTLEDFLRYNVGAELGRGE